MKRYFIQLIAILISLAVSFFFSHAEMFLLPLSTLIVMQTPNGLVVRRGLEYFLIMVLLLIFYTWLSGSMAMMNYRLYDIGLGTLIGIATNLFVFPVKTDVEFRKSLIVVLRSYSLQFSQMLESFFSDKKSNNLFEIQFLPNWIFANGLSLMNDKGHRHFVVMVERIAEILCSTHYILQQLDPNEDTPKKMQDSIMLYQKKIITIFEGLIQVLSLKKLSEGVDDASDAIIAVHEIFRSITPDGPPVPLSKEYVLLAAFIENLTDLRYVLIRLGQALRGAGA